MSAGHRDGRPQTSSSSSQQHVSAGKRARKEDGASNCYMFKSRLQEYAQKAGVSTPVYETTKEGPSHEPFFRSTVIVNGVRYDSLLGFMNRKAAEQSAAEVALLELTKSAQVSWNISQPVFETGLCKNLLQEYAQKMSYAVPLYQLETAETRNRGRTYQCSVLIGGTKYIGAVAASKKEAEIKAARTAWFAIKESSTELPERSTENTMLTVIPSRKRVLEAPSVPKETTNTTPQAKKARLQKKTPKKKRPGKRKPKSQLPKSGPSEHISNACPSANGQPGAEFQHIGVNGQAWCQYPIVMQGALGESINNNNPTPNNQPNPILRQMGGHGANIPEGGISGNSSHRGRLTLSRGNSGEFSTGVIKDSKGNASAAPVAKEDNVPSAVGSSTPDVVGDKCRQTVNVNHTCGRDSTVSENSKADTTMVIGVTVDSKLSAAGTQAADVGGHGANTNHTNGEDSSEIRQESKIDTEMASGATVDGASSAVGPRAPDVGDQEGSRGTNIHHRNGPDCTGMIEDTKGDTSMASGATANGVSSAVESQAPDVGDQEGSRGTNIHRTNGQDSTGMIADSKADDASMAS